MKEKVCSVCGKIFIPSCRTQQYCCRSCGMKGGHEKLKRYHICQNCGKKYTWTDGHPHKFCSRNCLREWQQNHRVVKLPISYEKECEWCGKTFIAHSKTQKYCSKDCGYNGNLKDKRLEWAKAYRSKTYVCKECGMTFTTECGNKHSVFCCSQCSNKYERRTEHKTDRHKNYMREHKKVREKQILRNFVEEVSYERIYHRDNGICQICGLPVIYDKHADNNWSGTIDHIIPVSLNGEHSMRNCQLAHRVCNSLKNQCTEEFQIDWDKKSKENNYWKLKYESLKNYIGA